MTLENEVVPPAIERDAVTGELAPVGTWPKWFAICVSQDGHVERLKFRNGPVDNSELLRLFPHWIELLAEFFSRSTGSICDVASARWWFEALP